MDQRDSNWRGSAQNCLEDEGPEANRPYGSCAETFTTGLGHRPNRRSRPIALAIARQ